MADQRRPRGRVAVWRWAGREELGVEYVIESTCSDRSFFFRILLLEGSLHLSSIGEFYRE